MLQVAGAAMLSMLGVMSGLWPREALAQSDKRNAIYRITFNGNDVTRDWVSIVQVLLDSNLLELATAKARGGDGLCSIANRELDFYGARLECSAEMGKLLARLNPNFVKHPFVDAPVSYPQLPLIPKQRANSYDPNVIADRERYARATTSTQFVLNKDQLQLHHGIISLVRFRSFYADVAVPDTQQVQDTLVSLAKFDDKLNEFTISVERIDQPGVIAAPYSLQDLSGWWKICESASSRAQTVPPPAYAIYLGMERNPSCEAKCVEKNTCPDLVLFDRAVLRHPALSRALHIPPPHPSIVASDGNQCPTEPAWTDAFHGTHLAGIIASDDEESVGAAAGLAPNVNFSSIDSLKSGSLITLGNMLDGRSGGFAIFTVASRFNELLLPYVAGDPRLTRSVIANKINNAPETLWVIAAGQMTDSTEQRVGPDVSKSVMEYPMNLGDLPNVVVVTACEHCLRSDATRSPWANYSTSGMISIAAPGGGEEDILAPASAQRYARAKGTSQATAFVAGVAAQMAACNMSITAKTIKLRLMLTAKPFFDSDSKGAVGAIDATTALLNPKVSVIRLHDQTDDKLQSVAEVKWCNNYVFPKTNDDVELQPLLARTVLRILRTSVAHKNSYGFWIAGLDKDLSSIEWQRTPVNLSDSNLLSVKFTPEGSWHSYAAKDIDDLILSGPASPGDCQ